MVTCETCKWCVKVDLYRHKLTGECRYNAPIYYINRACCKDRGFAIVFYESDFCSHHEAV